MSHRIKHNYEDPEYLEVKEIFKDVDTDILKHVCFALGKYVTGKVFESKAYDDSGWINMKRKYILKQLAQIRNFGIVNYRDDIRFMPDDRFRIKYDSYEELIMKMDLMGIQREI